MIWQFDLILLTLVVIFALISLRVKDLMGASIVFGAYSFLMCLIWAGMGAVDVAFTEAAVGAGVSTVFMIATIYNTGRMIKPRPQDMSFKLLMMLVVVITGAFLLTAVNDFPEWGDPYSPVNDHVAAYYLTHSMSDTAVPNVVTSVLADYRSFDTMFETAVVFVALIGIYGIIRRRRKQDDSDSDTDALPPYDPSESLIIRQASRMMVPFMQIFALYVVAHGHHSPGGGFQGGVILGASLILYSMSYNLPTLFKKMTEKWIILLSAIGVLIFSGVGVICMMLGSNFLDYSVLSQILPATDSVMARSHAMLIVEIGVAFTVMCAMVGIYTSLASNGRFDKGL
ncbi:MAG: sodium:proton antiporter [Actinobacteria bacterium]|nr:sodium:proton antiporter [Actinomycetota bacterium]